MIKTTPYVVAKYATYPINVELAREWLRADIDGYYGEDGVIASVIKMACGRIDTYCNIQIQESTFEWICEGYLPCKITDASLVKSIVSITVDDVLVSSANYTLIRTGERFSKIKYNSSVEAPSSDSIVKVVFTAGYGESEVPEQLMLALRAMIAEHFDNRGDTIREKKVLSEVLMDDFRVLYAG